MQLFTLTRATLGLALAVAASCAPTAKNDIGESLLTQGYTEVSEGVYFRNTTTAPSVNGSSASLGLAAQTHYCQISDMEDGTGDFSAKVDDCWQVYRNVAVDGEWVVTEGYQKVIASYGTCCFGITAHSGATVTIGNVDVHVAILESITQFARQFPGESFQRVSSRGRFQCGWNYGDACGWGIYPR
ncbi:putative necrosis-inducing factor-domain-containing protein [Cercophora samala]|uniref:Necrosis-inducing factor-domain-containing protein n=1 Tax=Cercophora samala TaxID=330535 RepID=A0AA39ZIL1_9PEZI|nr:putative necrosis-inducing factor-domain-containing protein [Cercophora samala]